MEEYTCYFNKNSANAPKVLFLSAFIDEYIFKLHFERINIIKNIIKTNESIEYINKNWDHADFIMSFKLDNTIKNLDVDYKKPNVFERYISVKSSIFNKDIGIGSIIKNVDKPGKLQLDVKYVTPELSGLVHTAYLYAIIDIYSRYKAGVILPALDQTLAIEALRYLIPGLPKQIKDNLDFIQTDNGLEYQERFLNFLKSAHQELQLPNEIKHHYIHKSSPNENAVIERSFRTDEEEFFWRIERPEDLTELNIMYQSWMEEYNTFRPHLGLDCMTPMEKLLSYNKD